MGGPVATEAWSSGESYEPYVGRWSRLVAREYLAWLGVPTGLEWLDIGCGTAALTQVILDVANPARVTGVDPSDGYVSYSRATTPDARATFRVGDARALPVDDASCDAVVSGLVLNFIPDRPAALAEMRRVARPGAVVAAYVWDYPGEMQLMKHFWDAAVSLDPNAEELHEGNRFEFCRPEPLLEMFTAAGFRDCQVTAIVVPTVFDDFDDYWTPFLGGQAPAPAYAASLTESDRNALRETLRARLPTAADGSIHLTARAWAIRGIQPDGPES